MEENFEFTAEQMRFQYACDMIFHQQVQRDSIGTLSEKTLHAALKYYFEPDISKQEVPIGRMVADIYNGDDIIEIQTRQFNKLRKKLDFFLPDYHVTIVHPIAVRKRIFQVDMETGAVSKGRLSPLKGSKYHIFPELYKIKPYLHDEHLHFCIMLLETEEYRIMEPKGRGRRRKKTNSDKVPKKLLDEIYINSISDYEQLLPPDLPEQFTSADFASAAGIPVALAQSALNILFDTGTVIRIGKSGHSYLYQVEGNCL